MAWTNVVTRATNYVVTATNWNEFVNDFKAIGDAWAAYTPVGSAASGGFALGNGTMVGHWMSAGKLTHGTIEFTVGSTTNFGTGALSITAPTAAVRAGAAGSTRLFDTSAPAFNMGAVWFETGALGGLRVMASTSSVTPTAPWTWATGDTIYIEFTFEAA